VAPILKTIINEGRWLPDGLVLDVAAGDIYWTNMGDLKKNDGSIMRSEVLLSAEDYGLWCAGWVTLRLRLTTTQNLGERRRKKHEKSKV